MFACRPRGLRNHGSDSTSSMRPSELIFLHLPSSLILVNVCHKWDHLKNMLESTWRKIYLPRMTPRVMKVRVEREKLHHVMTLAIVKDSENGMWSKYLGHVKEYDTELTETWKEDANGVLTFVGPNLLVQMFLAITNPKTAIFSATVAAFIIESYKKLSPDSGDKTTFLLDQLSQQFAGFANGTNIQPQPYQQSSPGVFIICVNIVWLLSLVLSSTSALFSTLTQQWARKYLQLPQIQSIPSERARVRSYLFHGTRKFAMNDIIQTAPTLLHLSVFLFNIGLVMYFYTICKPVAFVVLGSVGFFGVAYLTLTILPCLDLTCPYSTPLSRIAWFLVHCSASVAYSFFHVVAKLLHCLLVPSNPGEVKTWRQGILTDLRERIGGSRDRYKQRRRDGFRESIVKDALQAPRDIDFKALTWLFQLPALAEKSNFERFVATMPGKTAIELFSLPRGYGEVSFREHLSALLRSCASATVRLDEDVRSSASRCAWMLSTMSPKPRSFPTESCHPISSPFWTKYG